MSFDALEVSPQSGEPLELYRFEVGTDPGFPPAPAAPGALVVGNLAISDHCSNVSGWNLVRDEGTTSPPPNLGLCCEGFIRLCEPTSPQSAVVLPLAGAGFSVWAAYHGSIGGGGGWFFERAIVTADQGLLPNHEYIVRTLAGTYSAFEPHGIRIGTAPGVSENGLIGSVGIPVLEDGHGGRGYHDRTFTTDDDAQIVIDVGHFDLEISYANIVYLQGVWIYDAEAPADEDTPGGLARQVYNYTSADVDVVYNGETYLGGKASRFKRLQPFRPGLAERSRSEVEVAIPRDHLVAALVRGVRAAPIYVTVYALHRGDLTDARTPLQGEIADCRDEGASCILTLAGKGARLDRKIPILTTGRDCPNTLYDGRCRVSESAFQYTGGVVTAFEATDDGGVIVTVSGAAAFVRPAGDPDPDSYFVRGMLVTPDGFKVTIETVDPDDGDRLTVPFLPPAVVVGASVILSAGCSRTPDVCHGRFGNLENFLGEPTIPIRNPFGPAGLAGG